ncbi:MAG: hypothetical protein MEQ07_10180 [Aquimonas sp.]|nr:hypothetical protein [Aquimonas sp.]
MSYRAVPPGNAVNWITEAARLIMAKPAPFLLMGLAVTLISLVPLLGALVLLVIGPALYAGMAAAARAQREGAGADFEHLLSGLKAENRVGALIALCLPYLALVVVSVMVLTMVVLTFAGAAIAAGSQISSPEAVIAMLGAGGILTAVLVLLPLVVATFSLLFFAIPRVMFDGIEPFPAMRESAQACIANFSAFLLTVLALLIGRFVLAAVFGSLIPLLGGIVVGVVFTPLIAAVLYVAWRDVFPAAGEQMQADEAAQPSSAPPQIEV